MASAHNQAPSTPSTDLFDAYFQRADLDRDGRISGVEAVAFFNGSGLSKQVLAQIWALADQKQIGFLGRSEFYNALKLVTVAQKKRELTPEIVKAALYGPHAAKIPAPQINLTAMPAYQLNSTPAATSLQIAASTPTSSQNLGSGGQQVPPFVSVNPQQAPFQSSQLLKSPQLASVTVTNSTPVQLIGSQGLSESGSSERNSSPSTSVSLDQVGGGGGVQGISRQFPDNVVGPSTSQVGFGVSKSGPTASLPPRPQPSGIRPAGPQSKDSKVMSSFGNGVASNSFFGEDVFSATPSPLRQDSSSGGISQANFPGSSGKQPAGKPSIDSAGSLLPEQPDGGQFKQSQVVFRSHQQVVTNLSSGISLGSEISVSSQSPHPWPTMTHNDVQKYTKVFIEVDKDKDGKITGEEARNLFLSWRLPREILKQVWDLSDQDNDSMLSLREFCIALYLMERYREGRSLPAVVPSNIMFDFPNSATVMTNYNNAARGLGSGFQQNKGVSGSNTHSTPDTGVTVTPSMPPPTPKADEGLQISEQKSRVPVLEKHLVNQLSTEEQNSLNTKFQEATDAEKKVEELEKEILESREKIEFYRAKMQELILYKSRCDNRLNEITERVSADKREAESLAKKYEEKYKQIGDVASKLTIEEATFRDIQERKLELYQAIVKMEQDRSEDNVIQVRADRIQSDLDELVKVLNERCKTYGLRTKPTTLTELPFGWQTGIQASSADWDEEWDKFNDEGFTFVKELTLDVQNILAPPKQKSILVQKQQSMTVDSPGIAASSDTEANSEKLHSADEEAVESGTSDNDKSENELVKSVPSSPIGSKATDSPREFSDSNLIKTSGFDVSPRNNETRSDHGVGSPLFVDQSFDEPMWGSFDMNDDTDSVWGFNAVNTTKDSGHDNINKENYLFESGDFGLNAITAGVSQSSVYGQKKGGFSFDESVPSTPLFSSGNSPHRYEHKFDSFSRFDSFRMQDSGLSPHRETLVRFDSVRSSKDLDSSQRFQSFDDSEPFGSSGPFRTSQENQTPKRGSDNWSAF